MCREIISVYITRISGPYGPFILALAEGGLAPLHSATWLGFAPSPNFLNLDHSFYEKWAVHACLGLACKLQKISNFACKFRIGPSSFPILVTKLSDHLFYEEWAMHARYGLASRASQILPDPPVSSDPLLDPPRSSRILPKLFSSKAPPSPS